MRPTAQQAQSMGYKARQKTEKELKRSSLEIDLDTQLTRAKAPPCETEFYFHPSRQFRFDNAWPEVKFAVEVDGLVANGKGGHQTIDGVTKDYQKLGEALKLGWAVYRCTKPMIASGEAVETILWLLAARGLYGRR